MKMFVFSSILAMLVIGSIQAQECGPSCPVCSGNTEGALLAQNSLMISALAIPESDDENAVFNVRYGIFKWIDAGVGFTVEAEKLLWSVRVQPITEQESNWRPGIIAGIGSVQIGGSDQSGYCQATKSWEFSENLALRLSTGVATLLPDFDKAYFLAGATTSIAEKYSIFASYDGSSFHEGISWIPVDWLTLSFLMVESSSPAVSAAVNLGLNRE